MKTVRIYGVARNLLRTPPPIEGQDVWLANGPRNYYVRLSRLGDTQEWTRWFNLHSTQHMLKTYPKGYAWYQEQEKPVYLRDVDPLIPASVQFPRKAVQDYFGGPQLGSPGRYFTCTVCWLMALAIYEGFERIELHGFALKDKPHKPHSCYTFERPCFFYWVKQAQDRGIEVWYPKEVRRIPFEPGDPTTYTGPLYGYETSEPFWIADPA